MFRQLVGALVYCSNIILQDCSPYVNGVKEYQKYTYAYAGPTLLSLQCSCFTFARASVTFPIASAVIPIEGGSKGIVPFDMISNFSESACNESSKEVAAMISGGMDEFWDICTRVTQLS